jgi:acetolactate synthase I/II/III large subunit
VSEAKTTAELLAHSIHQAGIGHIFGYPGDPNLEFMEAARRGGTEFVLTRREGTAAFMADAYGQLTGLPGICMSTLGPGSTNLVNGVANAWLDRSPMIAVSGQMHSGKEATFTHQNVDHGLIFSPVSKWTARIGADSAASVIRKAFRTAVAERPGPVHLTMPINEGQKTATDGNLTLPPMAASAEAMQVFAMNGVDPDPVKLLKDARKPVIVAGMAAARLGASGPLKALSEKAGLPVIVSPKGKGVLSEDHPMFAGTLDMACNKYIWDFLAKADLVLCVGFDAVELIKPWSVSAPVIHIDAVPNTDQIYPAAIELVGAVPSILDALTDAYSGQPKWDEKALRDHRDGLFALYASGGVTGALNPVDVVSTARAVMPMDTMITMDVGSHKLLVGQGWTTYETGSVMLTNGLSSMGFSLPGAMTAKLLNPDRPVVCFTGDGGFAMVQSELGLAVELGLGLIVIVFKDGKLNRIELKQITKQYDAASTSFDPGDLVKIAEGMGADAVHVESRQQLADALEAAKDITRPLLIEACIDPAQYLAQF